MNGWGEVRGGSLNVGSSLDVTPHSGVRDGGIHGIGQAVWLRNEMEVGGRVRVEGEECQKNVLVMKCNQNVNIPYCGEYLSLNSG